MRPWRANELRPGMTAHALAHATGRSVDAARSAAKRHGVPLAPKRRGWPESVRQRVLQLRRQGETVPRVAAAVGVPLRTVQSWLERAA